MSRPVLVVGGASGLGARPSARSRAGHDVTFTYRSSAAKAEALAAELAQAHPDRTIAARPLDLSDRAAVEAFCEAVEGEGFYGYVHNAGQSADALAAMLDRDRRGGDAGQFLVADPDRQGAGARHDPGTHRPHRRGRFVAALQANAGNAAYAATKGALIAYCRTLAIESAKRGVTVNVIAPGFIDTEMLAPYAAHRAGIERQIPLGRFAAPDEVAALAAFLIGEGGAYITGRCCRSMAA